MKQIKILVALLFATAIAMPAMSATVTWTGGANARVGYQQLNADSDHPFSAVLMSGLSGNLNGGVSVASLTAAQVNFGTAFLTKLAGTGFNLAAVIGAEKALAAKAGFTQAQATIIGDAATFGYTLPDGTAIPAGMDAAKAAYGAWANATTNRTDINKKSNAYVMLQEDFTLAGYNKTSDYMEKGNYAGLKNENSINLAADIVSDSKKLTGKIDVKFATAENKTSNTRPIDLEKAWLKYDLGMLAIRYDTAGFNSRWDADVIYVGDYTGQNSLDFQIKPAADMGYVFFTLLSNKGLDGVKYQSTEQRTTPMYSAGYVYESSMIDANVGGVYDKYKGLKKDDGDVTTTDDPGYTGYMGFANVKVKSGEMGTQVGSFVVKLGALYGQNTSAFAGMYPADMEQATLGVSNLVDYLYGWADPNADDIALKYNTVSKIGNKNSTVIGAHLSATVTAWMGGMINFDARISQAKISESDPYFAQRYTLAVIQALDANFFVTLAGGYEQYSVVPGDNTADYAWGYEATVDFGYRF